MKRKFDRIMVLILILFICIKPTAAGATGIREIIRFLGNDLPVRYSIITEFEKLPQFDDNRTEQLNRLLRHISFSGVLDRDKSSLDFFLDDDNIFSLYEIRSSGNTKRMIAADSENICIIPEDEKKDEGMQILNGFSSISEQNALLHSLELFAIFFESLPEGFPEYCKSAAISEKYKDYGTAVKKITIRLSAEELKKYIENHPDLIPEECCVPDLRNVLFSGRQDFEFLADEEGKMIKIRYGGVAGFSEDDMRTVRLEWKTIRNNTIEKDELSLRTPDSNASRRNNLLLEHTWRKTEDNHETFSWKSESDDLKDGIRIRGIKQCNAKMENGIISGLFSETATVKNKTKGTEIIFNISGSQEDEWTGTLEIISKKDKIECEKLKAEFCFTPNEQAEAGDADQKAAVISGEEYSDIRKKIISKTLDRLLKLPAEDLAFLTEVIPDETLRVLLPADEITKEPEQ